MNTTLKYVAVVSAFTAGALAFVSGDTWAGSLAILAGVLTGVTIINKEKS